MEFCKFELCRKDLFGFKKFIIEVKEFGLEPSLYFENGKQYIEYLKTNELKPRIRISAKPEKSVIKK